jgi:hypothetical protein
MPACKILLSKMLQQEAAWEIGKFPLSNTAISWCIDDMSHDAAEVLCNKGKNNGFSIQVDESTEFAN